MPFYFVDFDVKLTFEAAEVLPRPPALGLQGRDVKAQGEAPGNRHPTNPTSPEWASHLVIISTTEIVPPSQG